MTSLLTPMKSPNMTARSGMANPLIKEHALATLIDFHSGEFIFITFRKDTSVFICSGSFNSWKDNIIFDFYLL